MAEQLLVFGNRLSPFSRRVELALKLKDVRYQYVEERLPKKSQLLLKYNPIYKKVPVLVHNGKPILESLVILEYIDENWSDNAILPQDLHQKARARFLAKYIDDKIFSLGWKVVGSESEEREKAIEKACKALEPLEKELKSNKFFGGEDIGFVDIVGIFLGHWVPVMQEALGFEILSSHRFPKLTKWSQELVSHSVVKAFLPPRDGLLAHTRTRYGRNGLVSNKAVRAGAGIGS